MPTVLGLLGPLLGVGPVGVARGPVVANGVASRAISDSGSSRSQPAVSSSSASREKFLFFALVIRAQGRRASRTGRTLCRAVRRSAARHSSIKSVQACGGVPVAGVVAVGHWPTCSRAQRAQRRTVSSCSNCSRTTSAPRCSRAGNAGGRPAPPRGRRPASDGPLRGLGGDPVEGVAQLVERSRVGEEHLDHALELGGPRRRRLVEPAAQRRPPRVGDARRRSRAACRSLPPWPWPGRRPPAAWARRTASARPAARTSWRLRCTCLASSYVVQVAQRQQAEDGVRRGGRGWVMQRILTYCLGQYLLSHQYCIGQY